MSFVESLRAEIGALETDLSKDTRYRRLLSLRQVLQDYEPAPKTEMLEPPDGFKLVPLTKEERVRIESTKYLKENENRAHRRKIADYLVRKGILDEERAVDNLAVYLARWDEFESDGKGFVVLRETQPQAIRRI